MRSALARFLYYTNWCRLIGWNPTRFCNWLANARIEGERYDLYGGARWELPIDHPDLYDHPED